MDLVVSASTGALQATLPKLAQMLAGEYQLHKGAKEGIRYIREELETMKAALEKVSEVPPEQLDPQVKIWARKVRDMSYVIEDTVESYMVHVDAAGESGSSMTCCVNLKGMLPRTCKARRDIATKIECIKKEVEEVSKRRDRCRVDAIVVSAPSDPRLPALYEDEAKLVGIDSSSEEIIKLLSIERSTSEEKLKLISIVGIGGMGKTTLANVVYQKFQDQFDCTAFVSVSLKPNIKNILSSILRQVTIKMKEVPKAKDKSLHHQESHRNYGNTETWTEKEVIDRIREVLEDKRYLLIIDDIWDEPAWNVINCVLVENKLGSKIITTTRHIDVAKSCCSSHKFDGIVHELQPLSDIDSEQLLCYKVFGGAPCPTELEDVSREILERCQGWPLAIVAISSLLANKQTQTKDQWCSVYSSIRTGLEDSNGVKDMRLILSLSYRDMPPQLRACLLYLSIFPEDHIFGRDDLIWRWVAEDFIHGRQDDNLYELGDKYFNELISRSMIQPANVDTLGRAQACRVHDMVLEFITSLSAEENFVTILNGQPFPLEQGSIHRLSLRNSKEEHGVPQATKRLPHVRTLVVSSRAINSMPSLSIFPVLRLLDLEHCTSRNIEGMGNLVHLRYLRLEISSCGWDKGSEKCLLKCLCNLKNLKTLCIFALDLSLDFMLQVDWSPSQLRRFTGGVCQTEHIFRGGSVWAQSSPFSTLPRWINSSLSVMSDLSIMVRILLQRDVEILADLPVLRTVDLEVIEATEGSARLEITSRIDSTGRAIAFRCLSNLKFASRAAGLVFRPGAMQKLHNLSLSFDLAETKDVHGDFNFGLENITSLKAVDVGIDCRGARVWQMQAAEAALRNATNLNPNQPTLVVMRHFEEDMLWDGKGEIPTSKTMKEEEWARLAKIGLWGGHVHGNLQDITVAPCRLESVTISSGEFVGSLAFSYSDHTGQLQSAGPWGGPCHTHGFHITDDHTILLGPSEFLIKVSGTMNRHRYGLGYVVTSLTLITNARSCGPFGRGGGIPFHTPMQINRRIVGFFVCTGFWFVDAIGFYTSPEPETMEDEKHVRLVKIGPWGGNTGCLRDIRVAPCRLESVIIRSAKVINSLAFSYSDHNGQQHAAGPWGGDAPYDGGCNHTILLGPLEFLIEVSGTMDQYRDSSGNVITSLTLVTNVRSYGPYGQGGGIPFSTPMQSNGSIVGFFARGLRHVEAIGFYVNPEKETVKHEEKDRLAKFGLWGGAGGKFHDITVAPCRLESVTICSGEVIISLAFSYSDHNGHVHAAGPWGDEGPYEGHDHTIPLSPSEFLIKVSGTMNHYVHAPGYVITSLTLVTNARSYGPFGEGGGVPFHTPMQSNGSIVGFFVRAGWFVDAIGVWVRPF